jgi:hypothetical protein
LWTLDVESLVELDLGKQIVNVMRMVVEAHGIPLAKGADVVKNLLLLLHLERNDEHLKANGTDQVLHAAVFLLGCII